MSTQSTKNRRRRRAEGTPAQSTSAPGTLVLLPTPGPGLASVTFGPLLPPNQIVAVDGAVVKLRHGIPELHLIQLDPTDDKKVHRLIVARFAKDLFLDRATVNDAYMRDLVGKVPSVADRNHAEFLQLLESASTETANAVLVDMLLDVMAWALDRGSVTLYNVATSEISKLLRGDVASAPVLPYAEFSMPTGPFFDMLASWQVVASELRK